MKFDEEETKCPEYAPEDQKGVTEAEREWKAKTSARPRLPKAFFAALALVLAAAFAGGGWLYYRANVLPEKYYMRAEALFKAADYAGALALYDKIMELKPERRDLFYYMAYCREQLGQSDDAIKFYEEHLKTEPDDVNAMTRLAWLCFARKDYNAALKWFREASKREMKNPLLWRKSAVARDERTLSVHRGDVSIDGADGFPTTRFGSAG